MVKVKICGITNFKDASAAVESGADALGFVFYKESRRYITPKRAMEISSRLPPGVLRVGVFVDAPEKNIRWAAEQCNLDALQLHGDESPEFCSGLTGLKVIKAFRIRRRRDLKNIYRYNVFGYLFDTYQRAKPGGTGDVFDWELVRGLDDTGGEVFLSGGLNPQNVGRAIEVVRPDWVDASSSLESSPARKDRDKVSNFIKAAKAKRPK